MLDGIKPDCDVSSSRSIIDTVQLEQWNSLESRSALLNSLLIPKNRENLPSPNELLSKGWILADIKASVEASGKTPTCIVLKQRSNSGYYGKLCYLGKQMADRQGFEPWRRSPAYTLSKRAPSTTRPPVLIFGV